MTAEFLRDAAMTAVVFGFFASGWFGWAQEDPPPRWRPWLIGGSVLSLSTAAAGGIVARQNWSTGSAIDADSGPTFGIIVGIETALAAAGAVILTLRKHRDLVPAWIALVVGLHLLPLAPLFDYPLLGLVGVLTALAAPASVALARSRDVTVSAVTGLMVGTILLAAAVASLMIAISL